MLKGFKKDSNDDTTDLNEKISPFKFFKPKEPKEPKEPSKTKKAKKPKEDNLKKAGLKVVRVVLWVALGFIFIRGTVTLVRADPITSMQTQEKTFMAQTSDKNALEIRAFSFAQNFAKDYMTHIPKDDDNYKKRVLNYMSQDIVDSLKFDDSDYTTVLYSQAYDIKKYSDNQYDVYVYLRVQYRTKASSQRDPNNIQYTDSENDVYLDVPVAYTNNFIVEDVPAVVAPPTKGYEESNTYDGNSVDEDTNTDVTTDLNQFFKAYYGQDQTQVNYFLDLDKNQSVNALNGRYKFDKIDKITTYSTSSKNVYLAIVEFNVKDVNGNDLPQTFNVKITNSNGKYYINALNTRSINISEN